MAIPRIITGDDNAIPIDLTINKLSFDMSGKSVKARIVAKDHTSTLTEAVVQSAAAPGADFANSRVMATFAPADTQAITYQGKAIIEVQVEFPEKKTWFINCEIVRGNIA